MKRTIAISLILAAGITTLSSVHAADSDKVYRVGGEDRYETSALMSYEGWDTSKHAVLATGSSYPDALSATPLAYQYDAPLLLTRTNALPASIKDELLRLKVEKVFLIGGQAAISGNVESTLSKMNIEVVRISGNDRYETSVKIAETLDYNNDYVIASGQGFADALSIAPVAARLEAPILLTKKDEVPSVVESYINETDFLQIPYIIGGKEVITDTAAKAIGNHERISGADRYETNSEIVSEFADQGILDMDYPFIATGTDFPDALSASALAAGSFNGVILTHPEKPKSVTVDMINKYSDLVAMYMITGGKSSVSDQAIDQLIK
ncbi:hypothetical protein JMA_28600 [Jeotgalibacillus malaysiensis]|uniref:N-acetylmuramoyl-L-alanine amidase n=1 Tax=Jeotgalibacillus malaysiensis TaxID=1508404 RepID=A0A0B5ATY3_9BACL|nr:cell wall-binding repeat-containing protein [Jeotgalibacillus malaysiensis]AJD92177.1 hypothetical protein JMA_28600 [Jeotgalibacillus malaysiensis]